MNSSGCFRDIDQGIRIRQGDYSLSQQCSLRACVPKVPGLQLCVQNTFVKCTEKLVEATQRTDLCQVLGAGVEMNSEPVAFYPSAEGKES